MQRVERQRLKQETLHSVACWHWKWAVTASDSGLDFQTDVRRVNLLPDNNELMGPSLSHL